jgi:transcription antitermination factor NusG
MGTAAFLLSQLGSTPPSKLAAPSLPEGVASVGAIEHEWFAVHSRIDGGSRDAAVAWAFYLAGLPFYYPCSLETVEEGRGRWRQKRKKRVSLFDGYLFSAGKEADKFCRENRDLIEGVIVDPRHGQLRDELLIVEESLKKNPSLKTRDITMPGTKVRITRGPWRNKEGIVEDFEKLKPGESKVWVPIETMGRLVPMAIDTSDIEPCE